jgi:hypothetical protein
VKLRLSPLPPRTSLAAALAALALGGAVAGCGGDEEPVREVDDPTTIERPSTETTVTDSRTNPQTPTSSTQATTPTGTTKADPGGARAPDRPSTTRYNPGGTAAPDSRTQDPDCKPGTGPGQPLPQCEPVSGPDAHENEE